MKKILLSLLFSVGLGFCVTNNVFATSGACSTHGGVNCAAGPDSDGSVICYDNWRNSSVSYSAMVSCSGASSYTYTPPQTSIPQPTVTPSYSDAYLQTQCETKLGSSAKYDPVSKSCGCYAGYKLNDTGSTCLYDAPKPPVQVYVPPASSVPVVVPISEPAVTHPVQAVEPIKIVPQPVVAKKKYVSTVRRVIVRLTPSAKAKILGTTVAKKPYEVLEEKTGWVKVKFGNKIGWIMRGLAVIK